MAKFMGTMKGMGNMPKQCTGSKHSGLKVTAQSYEGSVSVHLYLVDDVIHCQIVSGDGSTFAPSGRVIYGGTLADLILSKQ